jgi:hypothetical protein
MTLGKLIEVLEPLDPSLPIDADADGLHSYRGYYEQLAVSPGVGTVGELLDAARSSVGISFEGYKGGKYKMAESTPVWYSERGHASGIGILGVEVIGDERAQLITADLSDYV